MLIKRLFVYGYNKNQSIALFFLLMISTRLHSQQNYRLLNNEGIYVEKFDSTNILENRFTSNNNIYAEKKRFLFEYVYIDSSGNKYLQEILEERENDNSRKWRFIPYDKKNSNSLTHFSLKVLFGLQGFEKFNKDYSQTIIRYDFLSDSIRFDFNETTGLIENNKNIWLHPPRLMLFKILELNPFPFLMLPLKKGESWKWDLTIGDAWGDQRWKRWAGLIHNKMIYSNRGYETIQTPLGKLSCAKIVCEAASEIGSTRLVAYYHQKIGFVKLIYNNINNSKLIINLVSFNEL